MMSESGIGLYWFLQQECTLENALLLTLMLVGLFYLISKGMDWLGETVFS